MTKDDLQNCLEWVNRRCSAKGEPLTDYQKGLLTFIFTEEVVNKNASLPPVVWQSEHAGDCMHNLDLTGKCFKCGEQVIIK